MGKNKSQERIDGADLFINSTLTLKQVAAIIQVSPAQIGKWAKEDEWEIQRTSRQATAEKIISNYYKMIADEQKRFLDEERSPTPAEMDKLHKMADSIDKLKKKMNLGNYYNVLKEFSEHLMKLNIEAAKVLAPEMLEFLKVKSKQIQDAA